MSETRTSPAQPGDTGWSCPYDYTCGRERLGGGTLIVCARHFADVKVIRCDTCTVPDHDLCSDRADCTCCVDTMSRQGDRR
jgi:hypothetical protein